LWQNAAFFAVMVGVLVFANWGSPNDFNFKTKRPRRNSFTGKWDNVAIIKAATQLNRS